jgi:cellulose biosynthesis protein BcsQ
MFDVLMAEAVKQAFGAVVGATIKGWFDKKKFDELKDEIRKGYEALAKKEAEVGKAQEEAIALRAKLDGIVGGVEAEKAQLDALLAQLSNSEINLWLSRRPLIQPFDNYNDRIAREPVSSPGKRRPVIMTMINYKGGVGKTTTTGNLAAYFDKKLGKRVLLIDLDYQGSLTTMLRTATGLKERTANVSAVFQPGVGLAALLTAADGLGEKLPKSQLLPSFYEFARSEDQLMIQWLLNRTNDDLRYRLAKILLDDEIGKKFDIILIDAPPRLTTGTMNALCASTHVLVPTIMNPISAEPVINFLLQTRKLMNELNPKLTFLGVLETMTLPSNVGVRGRESARLELQEGLKKLRPEISILVADIPRRTALADGGLAYLTDAQIAATFNALGSELVAKIGELP